MPTLKQVFSENLRRLLSDRHISQSELARRVGVHALTINAIATGKNIPSPNKLAQIAKALEVEETDLVSVPKKLNEKIESQKDQWEKLSRRIEDLEKNKSFSVPQDILDGLATMNEIQKQTAWEMFRSVLEGLSPQRNLNKKQG